MTTEEAQTHRENLLSLFPHIGKTISPTNGFTNEQIEAQMLITNLKINTSCKRYQEILYNATIHNLIINKQNATEFENGIYAEVTPLTSMTVGDIKKDSSQEFINENLKITKWLRGTKYGIEADRLIKLCTRVMVGVVA